MKVKGVDPNTGKEVEIDIENPEGGFFEAMRNFDMSDEAIKRMIDKLNISADAKNFLDRCLTVDPKKRISWN